MPELLEIKNYSPLVGRTKGREGPTEYVGHEYSMGNTEEALKWRVLGTRQRAVPAAGPYDHKTGTGYVKAHRGDYADAICNRKARVKLLCHEIFGGMSSTWYAARHLCRLGRDAARGGADVGLTQPTKRSVRRLVRAVLRAAHLLEHRDARRAQRPGPHQTPPPRHGARRHRRRVSLRGLRGRRRPLISRDPSLRSSGLF